MKHFFTEVTCLANPSPILDGLDRRRAFTTSHRMPSSWTLNDALDGEDGELPILRPQLILCSSGNISSVPPSS